MEEQCIEVIGAREHNLKNIDVRIPREKLVVITGLSGSGKSSLAFDTIYAEGQRRYIETFSSYARQFLGNLERPDVDQITGLSPVISIEQKTISRNPRSTVGTVTEIYDFLRLLFARAATAYSYNTGEAMVRYSEDQIVDTLLGEYSKKEIMVLAPVVKGRKGHYRELLERALKQGFLRARIDGEVLDLTERPRLDRYKVHDIELVIDRLKVDPKDKKRLRESCALAAKHGKGQFMVLDQSNKEIRHFSRNLMCPTSGIAYADPEPNSFSFNSPYGACPSCNGLGLVSEVDIKKILPKKHISINQGAIVPLGPYKNSLIFKQLEALLSKHGFNLDTPIKDLDEAVVSAIMVGSEEQLVITSNIGLSEYTMRFEGVVNYIETQAKERKNRTVERWAKSFTNKVQCNSCNGLRLKREALYFRIDGKNISELAQMGIGRLGHWLKGLEERLNDKERVVAKEVLKEIRSRVGFMNNVGLNYLALDRSAKTLSGGEAQRIRLATQIGSQLVGVLYILDEPSIGLHQRDNQRLIDSLKALRDLGNSIIVVEHDKEMMVSSDHLIDMGPGAGMHGGHIITEGNPAALLESNSSTAAYLNGSQHIVVPKVRRSGNGNTLRLVGASGNNLKDLQAEFPLGKFICVTGVSGSGKSSLIASTLYPILSKAYHASEKRPLPYKAIEGLEHLDKVIEIDQSPIGRTPRSNPATYTGVFTEVRNLFANLPSAKVRGYKPGRFSFNTKGGRCETCQGGGVRVIEMNFLPDVYVHCESCNGKRFERETLEVRFKGKSISDVLDLSIEAAYEFFQDIPKIARKLKTLNDVGLGYLTLGQRSTTLSGGEAQRVKLATELSKKGTGSTFYILDEPTTGLHFEDIKLLIEVLNKLVDQGNTVLVIEHNLDIIKIADHIIDLGPDGGADGGEIIASGTPEEVAGSGKGETGKFLKKELTT